MEELILSDEQIETRAVAHALGLLAVVADAKAAKARLEDLAKLNAEARTERAAAEHAVANAAQAVAEADRKSACAEASTVSLDTKIANFQLWVDSSEKSLREREAASLERAQVLASREADLERRAAEHDQSLRRFRASLGQG
jgi:hypothetical protein